MRGVSRNLSTLCGLILAGAGLAQDAPPKPTDPKTDPEQPPLTTPINQTPAAEAMKAKDAEFAKLDIDADGYITRKEAEASKPLLDQFKALDTNNDGKLSLGEYEQHH